MGRGQVFLRPSNRCALFVFGFRTSHHRGMQIGCCEHLHCNVTQQLPSTTSKDATIYLAGQCKSVGLIAQTQQGQSIAVFPGWSCVVYPGESETLDLVIRTDVSPNSYGWNNESYFCNPIWRNPRWELPQGIHRVKVIITSSGQKSTFWFTLVNSAGLSAFHLE
jgi:hypothetical protein